MGNLTSAKNILLLKSLKKNTKLTITGTTPNPTHNNNEILTVKCIHKHKIYLNADNVGQECKEHPKSKFVIDRDNINIYKITIIKP